MNEQTTAIDDSDLTKSLGLSGTAGALISRVGFL